MSFIAIGGSIAAAVAGSVVSGAISSISNAPLLKAQVASLQLQGRVSQLSTQQQIALAQQLQKANTDTERLQIIENAVSNIQVSTVTSDANIIASEITANSQSAQNSQVSTAVVLVACMGALVGTIYLLNKD